MPEAEIVPADAVEVVPSPPTQVIPKNYPKKFMQCRALDHEWSHVPGLTDHPYFRYIKGVVSECLSCGLVRTRWLLSNGRRYGMRYEYPEGYQISKKDPRQLRIPVKAEWREKHVRMLGFREDTSIIEKKTKGKSNGGNASRTSVA